MARRMNYDKLRMRDRIRTRGAAPRTQRPGPNIMEQLTALRRAREHVGGKLWHRGRMCRLYVGDAYVYVNFSWKYVVVGDMPYTKVKTIWILNSR